MALAGEREKRDQGPGKKIVSTSKRFQLPHQNSFSLSPLAIVIFVFEAFR
jgi:hypothetical protein